MTIVHYQPTKTIRVVNADPRVGHYQVQELMPSYNGTPSKWTNWLVFDCISQAIAEANAQAFPNKP